MSFKKTIITIDPVDCGTNAKVRRIAVYRDKDWDPDKETGARRIVDYLFSWNSVKSEGPDQLSICKRSILNGTGSPQRIKRIRDKQEVREKYRELLKDLEDGVEISQRFQKNFLCFAGGNFKPAQVQIDNSYWAIFFK